jgi:hypothetical protein
MGSPGLSVHHVMPARAGMSQVIGLFESCQEFFGCVAIVAAAPKFQHARSLFGFVARAGMPFQRCFLDPSWNVS